MGSNSMLNAVHLGTFVTLALWVTALVLPAWRYKTYYLGFVNRAHLEFNLFSYEFYCPEGAASSSFPGVGAFCKTMSGDGSLMDMANHMCAIEEQSMGLLRPGCSKAQMVSYLSLLTMVIIGLTMLFTLSGAAMLTLDPTAKPARGLFLVAPILQGIAIVLYTALTFDLDDFLDTDGISSQAAGVGGAVGNLIGFGGAGAIAGNVAANVVANDLDGTITFCSAFFVAIGAFVCQIVLAWCACLFINDMRDREEFGGGFAQKWDGHGTFAQGGQQDQWAGQQPPPQQPWGQQQQQQQQQQWGQQPQQQWGAPQAQQWGAPQQHVVTQQQWWG